MARVFGKSPSFTADDSILRTVKARTLYVSNLAFDVTKDMVESAFDAEGFRLVRLTRHERSVDCSPKLL